MSDESFENRRNALLIAGEWSALAELLEEHHGTLDGDAKREVLEELGSVYLEQLEDPTKAFGAWDRMFRSGGNPDMIATYCSQILEQHPLFGPALERLDPVLRMMGDESSLKQLASHYLDLSDATDEPAVFFEYRKKAADIFSNLLQQPEGAFLVLSSALDSSRFPTLWPELESLARRGGTQNDLIDIAQPFLSQQSPELQQRVAFFAVEFERDDVAVDLLRQIAARTPNDSEVRDALASVYQRRGEWDGVLEALERDMDQAVDRVHQRELFEKYVATLRRAATETPAPQNAKWYATLGHVEATHLHDDSAAREHWRRAIDIDPDCIDAVEPLVDLAIAGGDWQQALPLLQTLCDHIRRKPRLFEPEDIKRRWLQLADAYYTVGDQRRKAADAIQNAYEIDANDPIVMLRYGSALLEKEEDDRALAVFRRIISEHPTALTPLDFSRVLHAAAKLALAKEHYGDARTWIVQSLEIDDREIDRYRVLNEVTRHTNQPNLRVQALQRLADQSSNVEEQLTARIDLGDTWAEIGRADMAARAYEAALAIEPNSLVVMRKLLALFQKTNQWGAAVAVLNQLAEHETDAQKRATYFYTIAILCRDELYDPAQAVSFFDRALDNDPTMLKSFEAIDRILTDARAWKELERAYRKMLKRVSPSDKDLLFLLWKNLGEVYRTRMGHPTEAIACFETAQSIRPDDEPVQLILAELYRTNRTGGPRATMQLVASLERDVRRFDTLESLFQLHLDAQRFDAAFNVAGVLHAFDSGNYEVRSFYSRYLGQNLKIATGNFYPELMEEMYDPELDRTVSAIFAIVTFAVRGPMGRTAKAWGVGKPQLADPGKPLSRFENMFWYFAKVVGLPNVELYVRRDHALGYRNMQTEPPAVLVGNDFLEPYDDRRLAFEFGKLLSGFRPELYLGSGLYTVENLNLFYYSALDFALGRKPTAGRDGATVIRHLKALPNQTKMQLQSLVSQLDPGQFPDLERWISAADHTTSRFGLLLCGDLQTAFRLLRDEGGPSLLLERRQNALARFAISESYIRIRGELGLGL